MSNQAKPPSARKHTTTPAHGNTLIILALEIARAVTLGAQLWVCFIAVVPAIILIIAVKPAALQRRISLELS